MVNLESYRGWLLMKRLFDILVSLILLICFSPIYVIFTLLVKVKLGSPIIFKQQRPGLYEKPFYLYKLRTMTDERDHKGQLLPDDKRLTTFGQFLRKYSIDEYPQIINVIKGDISLVGPRPLLMEYLPLYTKEQSMRHNVRPGITGWAQINGRNAITWEEKFNLDVWYVNNYSFLLDIKILFLTIYKVVVSEGINQPGNATMESFKGSNITVGGRHG
jgi:sugar transferase EpsL